VANSPWGMRCNWYAVVPALSLQRPRSSPSEPTDAERKVNTTVRTRRLEVEGLDAAPC